MHYTQKGILADVPQIARYITLDLKNGVAATDAIKHVAQSVDCDVMVVGFGSALIQGAGSSIDGLRAFPVQYASAVNVPSTQADLWLWIHGDDRGDLVHQTREIVSAIDDTFEVRQIVDAFQYRDSRDLTGYEDGTENPKGDEAIAAGIVQGKGAGIDGSSFVAVQQWIHDLDYFKSLPQQAQDNIIGRRLSDNEEFDEAPESAHVKRTAQESYSPEAFILRRSMPWSDATHAGLMFVAFGHSFDAYEAILNRMTGGEDGIIDAMFRFTRPVTGSFFWCPPVKGGQLDLSAVNL